MSSISLYTTATEFTEAVTVLQTLEENYVIGQKKKSTGLASQIAALVASVDALQAVSSSTAAADITPANLAYWKGAALNVGEDHNPEAEALLTRAAKLDPSNISCWNTLADCFWKKGDLPGAKNCLTSALEQKQTKETLRKLSLVVKNLPAKDRFERQENATESLKHARAALGQDFKDGESWYVLGNALLADYFLNSHQMSTMEQALKAYNKAEEAKNFVSPDLYFNRGVVHKFLENYQDAINAFTKAIALDPTLSGQKEIDSISRFVKKLEKIMRTKYGMKQKRLEAMVQTLPVQTAFEGRKNVPVIGLRDGPNDGSNVTGIVVAPVNRAGDAPVSFILACPGIEYVGCDFVMVSCYNVATDFIDDVKRSDVLSIVDPVLKQISISTVKLTKTTKTDKFPCIVVGDPSKLRLNGNKLSRLQLATGELKRISA